MTGGDVDRARTGIHGNEIGRQHDRFAIEKRVSHFDFVDLRAGKRRLRFADRFELCIGAKLRNKLVGEQQRFSSGR